MRQQRHRGACATVRGRAALLITRLSFRRDLRRAGRPCVGSRRGRGAAADLGTRGPNGMLQVLSLLCARATDEGRAAVALPLTAVEATARSALQWPAKLPGGGCGRVGRSPRPAGMAVRLRTRTLRRSRGAMASQQHTDAPRVLGGAMGFVAAATASGKGRSQLGRCHLRSGGGDGLARGARRRAHRRRSGGRRQRPPRSVSTTQHFATPALRQALGRLRERLRAAAGSAASAASDGDVQALHMLELIEAAMADDKGHR